MTTRKKLSAQDPQLITNPAKQIRAAIDPCGGVKIHAAIDPVGGVAKPRKQKVLFKIAKPNTNA